MQTPDQFHDQFIDGLEKLYHRREVESIAKIVYDHLEIDYSSVLTKEKIVLDKMKMGRLSEVKTRLLKHEPIQYILGHAFFFDLPFEVSPVVLIPRQETEELVDLIIRENNLDSPRILDIGTGSGCIAISLKKNIPGATVNACDNSFEALKIAEKNATQNKVTIQFHKKDVLRIAEIPGNDDIIVSNPPYVTEQEKLQMNQNVLKYEPSTSLFVPNNDPLVFYLAIIELAARNLNKRGKLYLEINETKGDDVRKLLAGAGFQNTRIIKDLNSKDRIAACEIM